MAVNRSNFEYSNLSDRPAGRFIRIGSKFLPGIRRVQAQIVPYAEAWNRSNRAALKQTGPLWVVLGDSMSQGVGASAYDHGWVGQLQNMLRQAGKNYRLVNLSMSGARITDVLEKQLPAMRALGVKPGLVTVLIGSNDNVSRKYRRYIMENYSKLLEQLPPSTFLLSPFGNFGIGVAVNQLIQREAHKGHIRVVDNQFNGGFSSWKGKLAADHFHPNDAGYEEFASLFYEALKKTL